jgi:hypothetical protein
LVELQKEYITKLKCEKYVPRVTYWAPLEMLAYYIAWYDITFSHQIVKSW